MTGEALIDTHVHFWDHAVEGLDWAWLRPGFTFRRWRGSAELDAPSYLPPDLRTEAAGCELAATVHVHAADPVADPVLETAWLEAVAGEHGTPEAIVGSCTLADPGASELLRRHAEHPRFRGVRDPSALEHLDVDACAAAMSTAQEFGISVEIRRAHDQFAELEELAARWPDVPVLLSHACLPLERTAADLASWSAAMGRLARYGNVVCKISAVAGASDPDWTVASIRPWVLACVDAFGPDRCVLGSNWPVDRLFGTYRRLIDGYRESIRELDAHERAAVLHGTASRVYRIGTNGPVTTG